MSGGFKVNRVKSQHASELGLLADTVKMAQDSIAKLNTTRQNFVEERNMRQTLTTFGAHCRADGFDPTRTFQHVARFDTEVWTLVLDMFAKYDPESGELMDDGLLYKTDPNTGSLRLNKTFFYAILDYLESNGVPCDFRGKIKLN